MRDLVARLFPDATALYEAFPPVEARRISLPIQLAPLPTCSPWANPVKQLLRWPKRDVLHLHRLTDD